MGTSVVNVMFKVCQRWVTVMEEGKDCGRRVKVLMEGKVGRLC